MLNWKVITCKNKTVTVMVLLTVVWVMCHVHLMVTVYTKPLLQFHVQNTDEALCLCNFSIRQAVNKPITDYYALYLRESCDPICYCGTNLQMYIHTCVRTQIHTYLSTCIYNFCNRGLNTLSRISCLTNSNRPRQWMDHVHMNSELCALW
jgi:hypothetical protein